MARRIGDTPFQEILPDSIASDPVIKAAAASLDAAFAPSLRGIPDVLLFARLAMSEDDGRGLRPVGPLPVGLVASPESVVSGSQPSPSARDRAGRTSCAAAGMYGPLARLAELSGGLPALPEDVLDSLAWQLHVDGYEAAASYEDKRRMVDRSLLLHRRKGTPWAVAEALRALGYADARIIEGGSILRYDGEGLYDGANSYAAGNRWALFDVEVDLGDGMGISAASVQRLRVAVNAWKNVRSWLRALSWRTSLSDDAIVSDVSDPWTVRPSFADARPWGFPLYNGAIRYDNGIFRVYDGRLSYDGTQPYKPWAPAGYLYNAQLDSVTVAARPAIQDDVRFQPLYSGILRHDGQSRYDRMDVPALDATRASLSAGFTESVPVREQAAVALEASMQDHVGRYYDGTLSYGQRHISVADGAFFYDGSRAHGLYGGKSDFYPLRYDGKFRHDKSGSYSLWGWLPGAASGNRGPMFTYQTLSDRCAAVLRSGMEDVFPLGDDMAVRSFRYTLHGGGAKYNGAVVYSAKEVQ